MTPEEVNRLLQWPPETWSPEEHALAQQHRAQLQSDMFALADEAERCDRNLTSEEQERFARMQAEFDRLGRVPSQR